MFKKIETIIKNEELVKKRRKQIITASLKLFLTKGYAQTTVREIAKASKLSMGNLYNYINSKKDILYLVYNEMIDLIYDSIKKRVNKSNDPLKQLISTLKIALEVVLMEVGEHILILYREGGSLNRNSLNTILKKESNFVKYIESILIKGAKKGNFKIMNTYLAANMIVFLLVFGILRKWNIKDYKNEENN